MLAAGPGTDVTVDVVHSPEALKELAPSWDRLAGLAPSPMQQATWGRACAASLTGREHTLHVVVAGAGELTGIAPLVKRAGSVERLELLETRALGEIADFIYASPDALVPVAAALVRSRLPIALDRLPADSPVVPALRQAYRGRALVIVRPAAASPWIPLDASWTRPEEHLNAGRRSDLRRARRRADEYGPVRCEIVAPKPDELPDLLEEAFRIEASGWKGRAGTALVADRARSAFVREYATAEATRGQLRLCFLWFGGKAAAMQLAVEAAGAFWLLKIAYDDQFARCSPGTLLMVETIRYAASRGLGAYEFLGSVESWTPIWTQHARPALSLRAYPASSHGVAALATDLAAAGRRALVRARSRRP